MTNREFLNSIIATETLPVEIREHAQKSLEALDARNAKRAATPSKTQLANEPLKAEILAKLKEVNDFRTAGEVSSWFGLDEENKPKMSVQKASSLLRQLVAENVAEQTEVKVPKKGKQKAYKAISE